MSDSVAYCHAEVDRVMNLIMAQPQNAKHCCAKGCHACCSEPVYASEAEVDHILEALTREQKMELALKVMVWLEKTGTLLHENMPNAFEWRNLDAPCPFLKDGLCSVYSRRPYGCRVWYASGNPKDCDMPARIHQKFLEVPKPVIEYIAKLQMNEPMVIDNMGVWLAEKLLGIKLVSGSRQSMAIPEHRKHQLQDGRY